MFTEPKETDPAIHMAIAFEKDVKTQNVYGAQIAEFSKAAVKSEPV